MVPIFRLPPLTSKNAHSEADHAALAASKRNSRQGSPVLTVLLALFATAFLLAFSMDSVINNFDDRIFVTTTESFYRFFLLRDVFTGALNFSVPLNPPSLLHGVFDPIPDSLQEWQDLRNRRLISAADYDRIASSLPALDGIRLLQNQGSLLWRLLRISWCSYPNALAGTTPTTRSPGCECIGNAYVGFIRETIGNLSGSGLQNMAVVNTSLQARQKYGSEVITCFDRRQVSRTQSCGLVCSTHSGGLVLYVNIVTFLALCAYLAFSEYRTFLGGCSDPFTCLFVLKVFIVLLAAGLASPFIARDVEANIFNLTGIVLCVVYITLTLHDELNFPAMDQANSYVKRR
jgi:hypothetical protein